MNNHDSLSAVSPRLAVGFVSLRILTLPNLGKNAVGQLSAWAIPSHYYGYSLACREAAVYVTALWIGQGALCGNLILSDQMKLFPAPMRL